MSENCGRLHGQRSTMEFYVTNQMCVYHGVCTPSYPRTPIRTASSSKETILWHASFFHILPVRVNCIRHLGGRVNTWNPMPCCAQGLQYFGSLAEPHGQQSPIEGTRGRWIGEWKCSAMIVLFDWMWDATGTCWDEFHIV